MPKKTKSKQKPLKFKGWDYTEMYKPLGIKWDSDTLDSQDAADAEFEALLLDAMCALYEPAPVNKDRLRVIKVCRDYLDVFIKSCNHYGVEVYEGLARVDHDETFLSYFSTLYQRMWT